MSYQDFLNEPIEEVERSFLIWEMDEQRDKLKAGVQRNQQR